MAKRDLVKESVRNSILFARHVVPATVKPARTLWNEIIGFIFLVFAFGFGYAAIQTAVHYSGDPGELIKLVFAGVITLVMSFYGWQSFRKARRISRS